METVLSGEPSSPSTTPPPAASPSTTPHTQNSPSTTPQSYMPSSFQHTNQQFNVDYFTYPWDELDLKTSWSVITKHKKTYIDGIRLENASWRKWMQTRLNLRKVPPDTLRWKKDEDITWLYGPFWKANASDKLNPRSDMEDGHNQKISNDHTACSLPNQKRSALKTHSVVKDLKKFQTITDKIFSKPVPVSPTRPSSSRRRVHHSMSDSELLHNPVSFLKPHEKRLLEQMDSGLSPISTTSSPTKFKTGFESEDSDGKPSAKLRFSTEVEVLEFQDDWRIAEPFGELKLLDRRAVPQVHLPPQTQPQTNTSGTGTIYSNHAKDEVMSISSDDSSIHRPALTASTSSIEPVVSVSSPLEPPSPVAQHQQGGGWVQSVFSYATDLITKYYPHQ